MSIYLVQTFAIIGVVSVYVIAARITGAYAEYIFDRVMDCRSSTGIENLVRLCSILWPLMLPILLMFNLFF